MYDRIMVPLDGSVRSEQALPVALGIASRTAGEIDLVHVWDLGSVPSDANSTLEGPTPEAVQARARIAEYLESLGEGIRRGGGRAHTTVLNGRIAEQLERHARDTSPDIIVMTTHARGPISRFWLGSVADSLVRHCLPPVLLVRPVGEERPELDSPYVYRNMVIPVDGSERSARIMEHALPLGRIMQAAFHLIAVVPPPFVTLYPTMIAGVEPDAALLDILTDRAQQQLDALAAPIREAGLSADTMVRVESQVAGAILDFTAAGHHDLIAMQTSGRGGLPRVLLGSVADKIVRGAQTAVLLYRACED